MKYRRRASLIISALAMGLYAPSTLQAGADEIDKAAQKLLDAGAAGVSMALIDGSGMTWSEARGYADIAAQVPMSIDTVLNIASISKTVTATSLMLLVEQGKLDLDRDINSYLTFTVVNEQYPDEIMTTRQLLTHTSATIDRSALYFSETSYHPGGDNPLSLGEFLQAYLSPNGEYYEAGNFATYRPGKNFQYSNIGGGQFQETRILAKKTVETMFTLQFAPGQVLAAVEEDENHQQALAWSYHSVKAGKMVLGHGGGDPGVTTDAQFFPGAGVGAILLVNTSSERDDFRQAFENLMGILLDTAIEGVE